MTYPIDAAKYRGVESEGSAGAPADEIEVTREMIDAGKMAYSLMDSCDFFCDPDGWISFIYRKMAGAKI